MDVVGLDYVPPCREEKERGDEALALDARLRGALHSPLILHTLTQRSQMLR
jgi:hypothetical protein